MAFYAVTNRFAHPKTGEPIRGCWEIHRFPTKDVRDEFVSRTTGRAVRAVTRKEAKALHNEGRR